MELSNKFISFEGIEGSGKSTQISKLAQYLESKGHKVLVTLEPGGTPFGIEIRRLLLDSEFEFKNQLTELCLFTADRLEHLDSVVLPALSEGKWVLCDRYVDSTIAYQHGGREIPFEDVSRFCELLPRLPDLTILLDLPVEEGLARAKARSAPDRFEREQLAFHKRVRDAYLEQAQRESERFSVIDVAGKGVDEISGKIQKFI